MIVFLGWGSLIWDSKNLSIKGEWYADGPQVKVEFKRQSNNGRLTLVLSNDSVPVPSLWAVYDGTEVNQAVENLRDREGCNSGHIGIWNVGDAEPENILNIADWAEGKGITSVIWTALPEKFDGKNGYGPSITEAIEYLESLDGDTRNSAKEYIQKAPNQIETEYRKKFEARFGWSFFS